ncbi:helix-turn-helix domain-containing protein [Streptomyces sp. NPDC012438]|uniref:helix-turn-helix domain-containing protein n=1 Tax=Streptomyces sp. NPDC012438 TaxID=3364833 RepID=UPI0036F0F888
MSAYSRPGIPSLDQLGSGPGSSPIVLRLTIGSRLRKLRDMAGYTPLQASERIRCHESKISRMECGKVPLKARDVQDLLELYGADPKEAEAAAGLVEQSNEPGWWEQYSSVVPDWFDKLIGLQEGASVIWTYEVLLVPGLLQTPEYAFAVAQAGFPLADRVDIEARVKLRVGRQRILSRDDGPRVWALFDGDVLTRKRVGSREVMYQQISHLLDLADHPRITLQIVPESFVVTAGTPITLIRFPVDLPDVVYLENSFDARYLERPRETAHFRALLDPLSTTADTPEETRDKLVEALKLYR